MDLTEGDISKHIRQIAIPASLGFFFNTMFNVVDTYFAGWISTDALAALSISFPIFFIVVAFVQGLATGASAIISNTLGARNEKSAEQMSAQILSFAFLSYLVIAPLGMYVSRPLFEILGASGSYLDMAESYMQTIFLGSIFFMLLYAANAILLARGNSRVLKNYLIGGFFLNAALNPLFLFGGFGIPAMGFPGIAVATVTTMVIGFFYITYEVVREGHLKDCRLIDFIPQKRAFIEIAKQSIPACLNMMTIGIGIFIISYFIKNFGPAAIAAYGIGMRIEQIVLLPSIGLTIAALAITGQNNGAKLYGRVEETLRTTLRYGLVLVLLGCLIMLTFSTHFFSLFTHDQEVLKLGPTYLRIAALTSWAYIILGLHISTLQGMKRPFYPFLIGCLRQIVVPILVFYIVMEVLGGNLTSLWWSIFAITWIAAIITVFYTRWIIKNTKNDS